MRQRARKAQEAALFKAEKRQAENHAPQTAAEFERMLVATPHSSFVWMQYMAFHLQRADVEAAREVAERAIKQIDYRQDEERRNVWIALLNLEQQFGTPESLQAVFRRACQANDERTMFVKLAGTYQAASRWKEAFDVFEKACSKFKESVDVWLAYARALIEHKDWAAMRKLLPRAVGAVPRTERVVVTEKFALFEFRGGDVERGRTLMETLLSNYPKKIDLWSVFLDQEERLGDVAAARRLYERVTSLNLSTKKMKYFFKRFLEFESAHGDAASVEHVKAKAVAYVESKASVE